MVVEICIIYYIKNNYMFRSFSLAIFRLINEKISKQLHSTSMGCIQWVVRGGVGTRSRMCCVGWVVWVHGGSAIFYSRLIYLDIYIYITSTNIRWYHRSNCIKLEQHTVAELHVPTPPILHNTCEISYPLHLLPPHCIQPTQVECSCLLSSSFINVKMANEKGRNT